MMLNTWRPAVGNYEAARAAAIISPPCSTRLAAIEVKVFINPRL
jgi:hypothetical protein